MAASLARGGCWQQGSCLSQLRSPWRIPPVGVHVEARVGSDMRQGAVAGTMYCPKYLPASFAENSRRDGSPHSTFSSVEIGRAPLSNHPL